MGFPAPAVLQAGCGDQVRLVGVDDASRDRTREDQVRVVPRLDRRDRPGRVDMDQLGVGVGVTGLAGGPQTGVDEPADHPARLEVYGLEPFDEPDQQLRVQITGVATPSRCKEPGDMTQAGHGDPHRGHDPGRAVPASADDQLTPHRVADLDTGLRREQHRSQPLQRQDLIRQASEPATVEPDMGRRLDQQRKGTVGRSQRRRRPGSSRHGIPCEEFGTAPPDGGARPLSAHVHPTVQDHLNRR
ncbi:hypothetical protein [Micromonospora sp. NPDC005806]|uniref:hypothetical protein n=1 Tax=Micromonospora sp. NPDC005806 TaxID=3364234 RepID=UPI0036B2FA22